MEQQFIDEAAGHDVLGPAYFAARDIARRYMEQFQENQFAPLAEEFAKLFCDKLWDDICAWLLSDTESNLQGEIWRNIDGAVKALLSGEPWALQRYALGSRHDCEKIREAVARHIPTELQDKRVADLESEVERLKVDLKFYREHR